MSLYNAFIAKILEEPTEDLPRLVFCDWLEENNGDACAKCGGTRVNIAGCVYGTSECQSCETGPRAPNGFADRAEFIRLQLQLEGASDPNPAMLSRADDLQVLHAGWRAKELNPHLLRAYGDRLVGLLDPSPSLLPGAVSARYRRGFIAEVHLDLLDWWRADGGPLWVRSCPIRRVTLSDRQPAPHPNGRSWWWFEGDTPPGPGAERAGLPGPIYRKLQKGRVWPNAWWETAGTVAGAGRWHDGREYETQADAVADLSTALRLWAHGTVPRR